MNNLKNIKLLKQKTNQPNYWNKKQTNPFPQKERGKEWDEGIASKFIYPSLCPVYRTLTWTTSSFCRSLLGFALFVFLFFPSLFLSPVLQEAKIVNSTELSSESFSIPWRGDLKLVHSQVSSFFSFLTDKHPYLYTDYFTIKRNDLKLILSKSLLYATCAI